jgi:hypothetical protein
MDCLNPEAKDGIHAACMLSIRLCPRRYDEQHATITLYTDDEFLTKRFLGNEISV